MEAQSSNVQVYRERWYFGSRTITRGCRCPCLRTPGLCQRYQSSMCSESSCLCLWEAQPPWCHLLEMARRKEVIRDCCSIRDIWYTNPPFFFFNLSLGVTIIIKEWKTVHLLSVILKIAFFQEIDFIRDYFTVSDIFPQKNKTKLNSETKKIVYCSF